MFVFKMFFYVGCDAGKRHETSRQDNRAPRWSRTKGPSSPKSTSRCVPVSGDRASRGCVFYVVFSFVRRGAARSGPTNASGPTTGTARHLCSRGDASRDGGAPAWVVLGVPCLVRGSQCPFSASQSTLVRDMPGSFLLFAVRRRDWRPRTSCPRDLCICY